MYKNCFLYLFWHSNCFLYTTCSELVFLSYWTRNSMNNLWSYFGLTDARMSASEKDWPVPRQCFSPKWRLMISGVAYISAGKNFLELPKESFSKQARARVVSWPHLSNRNVVDSICLPSPYPPPLENYQLSYIVWSIEIVPRGELHLKMEGVCLLEFLNIQSHKRASTSRFQRRVRLLLNRHYFWNWCIRSPK